MSNHEAARAAANIYLDMVTAFDDELGDDDPLDINGAAMNLAFRRFDEVQAVSMTWDDEMDEPPVLDVSPLMGGTIVPMKWLVGRVAALSRTSEQEVIADLRQFVQEAF